VSARERLTLSDQLAVEGALDLAFAPLAACRSTASAARVRAAARWGTAGTVAPQRSMGVVAPQRSMGVVALRRSVGVVALRRSRAAWAVRVAEHLFAASVAALLLVGVGSTPAGLLRPPSVIEAYFRAQPPADEVAYLRWLRLAARDTAPAPGAGLAQTIYVDKH